MTKQNNSNAGAPPSHADPRGDTRERLLKSAATLFAKNGFDGTTVKEIAGAAGANISLVSYHFNGKEGLYRACLEQFGKERLAAAHRVLQTPNSLEEVQIRLQLFFEELLIAHIEQPEITQLIHRESDQCGGACEPVFKETFLKSFETLIEFFSRAQKAGILESTFEPNILAGLAFGAVINSGRADKLNRKYFNHTIADPKYRKTVLDCVIRAFTTSFSTGHKNTVQEGAS
ncbi:MAG TPA: hypothetical protein DCS07_06045 [Bdellovibrionales bacterium]|nr:MAG: hypothetical protein A2Z97_00060 [Bdellovibrionales bacterium GWB1_52_6]OFZ04116.1 MAG: hypothetical protein A2X97_15055 [Bdellovibrionales bacterium GWA1_52_35]OFZ36956.1 MAG: hypothetical protein A2070_00040 [Bdellovibrionales bacterium GWC1_52_8]HAR42178.1 hypothetical protein [Bdellovibrionales bacterium]HCM39796.1 hypothetical protein [Bdellovibrionales bacterium]